MGTEQKVAIITGASQGIGAALIKAYRDQNYRVVAVARSIKPSNDDGVLTVAGDIVDPKTSERAIFEGVDRFGRIDRADRKPRCACPRGFPEAGRCQLAQA